MGRVGDIEDEAPKKGRRRKKQLYSSILQQMEFYFSDANLSKDRFLSGLTNKDPYVEISLFLKFNKISKLTNSVKDITQAIRRSEMLELSEDNTRVKRTLPVVINPNVENCTLYVERLKSDASHEWLHLIFSEFGNVAYISIPKYKHNQTIKGFAFVEFENEESVVDALQYFEQIGCKIPSNMEPEKLYSITTYHIEAKNNEDTITKKDSDSSCEDEPVKKKAKLEECGEIKENINNDETGSKIVTNTDVKEYKEKKPSKKRSYLKKLGLQVLSKKEWKKMRNRYLDMQRKNMKLLKSHLNRQRFAPKGDAQQVPSENDTVNKIKKEEIVPSEIEFVPNVIVKFGLQEPCYMPKIMRRKIKAYSSNIKYVEIPFGSTDAYLRFGDNSSASDFCVSEHKEKVCLLEGDDEKNYWNKISESSTAKKEKQKKVNKIRGRDKLLKKAEKHTANHIHFGEDAFA